MSCLEAQLYVSIERAVWMLVDSSFVYIVCQLCCFLRLSLCISELRGIIRFVYMSALRGTIRFVELRISPWTFEKSRNGLRIVRGLGETDSWKKPEVENLWALKCLWGTPLASITDFHFYSIPVLYTNMLDMHILCKHAVYEITKKILSTAVCFVNK